MGGGGVGGDAVVLFVWWGALSVYTSSLVSPLDSSTTRAARSAPIRSSAEGGARPGLALKIYGERERESERERGGGGGLKKTTSKPSGDGQTS